MCPQKDFGSHRGFTLLEVLIAVAIVAIGFTSLLGLHASNIRSTIFNQNMSRATLLARDLISELQFRATTQGIDAVNNFSGNLDEPGFRFEVEIRPTELDSIRQAVVRVIFDERSPHACEVLYYVNGPVS